MLGNVVENTRVLTMLKLAAEGWPKVIACHRLSNYCHRFRGTRYLPDANGPQELPSLGPGTTPPIFSQSFDAQIPFLYVPNHSCRTSGE